MVPSRAIRRLRINVVAIGSASACGLLAFRLADGCYNSVAGGRTPTFSTKKMAPHSILKTGRALPPPVRALSSSYLLLPLPLEPDRAVTLYLHLVGDTSPYGEASEIGGSIQRMDANEAVRRDVLFGQGIYGGIILALVLYNLILYGAIGERAYLYYSLYVLTFGSVWIARTGFFFQYPVASLPGSRVGVAVLSGGIVHRFQ